MINEKILNEALCVAMGGGADFVEIFAQRSRSNRIDYVAGRIDNISDNVISGVGIRAFAGTRTVMASTTDLSREGIVACARSVAEVMGECKGIENITLTPTAIANAHKIARYPTDVLTREKSDLLRAACMAAKGRDELISQVEGTYMDVDRTILVANTEGLLKSDRQVRTRMIVNAVASKNGENQSGFCGPGRGCGFEFFETVRPEQIGIKAADQALTNLRADYCPAGQMTVAIENGFGGVIFHEACGHSLEATQVGVGMSEMCGKLGQQIANEKVTAIDDGTIVNGWGSSNIDDEGTPTQRNVLIEKGVLKSYLIDRLGSRRMGMAMTGNSRRQSYTFEPTSRMTNTFIDNGPDKNEDIIASIEYGLYAKEMGGGSVNPLTGAFNFSVKEGYIVRNGKICEAVRGASLIGTGSQILKDIDMVGQNLATGQGVCGSSSGNVPTDVGQPLIRVSKITVGGR